MEGHGEKFSRKMEQAIIALLSAPSIAEAAKVAGVGETTLWRWLQDDEFQDKYREAKRQALSVAIAQLQQSAGEAVQTLRDVAADAGSPASSRVSAAKSILELAIKAAEIEDLEQRLSELEKAVNSKK